MSYNDSIRSVSFEADTSIDLKTGVSGLGETPNSGFQYRFVKITGAKTVGLQTADDNGYTVGVLQNKPQIVGAAATVAIRGISMVEAGAPISAGALVCAGTGGAAIPIIDGNSIALGIAVEAATANTQIIPVLLQVN